MIHSEFEARFWKTVRLPGSSVRSDIWNLYVNGLTGQTVTIGVPHGEADVPTRLAAAWNLMRKKLLDHANS